MIPSSHADILEKKSFAHIATLMPDGSPQVTAVWVDVQDGKVLVNSAKGRLKDKNMERDRRVAVSATDPDNPYRSIAIRGKVVEIRTDGADAHIDKMAKKYMGQDKYPFRQPGEVRVIYVIEPEKVSVMGAGSAASAAAAPCPCRHAAPVRRLPAREHLAHPARQAVGRERLLQEFHACVEHPVVHDRVVGVPRHEEHAHLRALDEHLLGEHAAAHLGHDHVGEQEIDLALVIGGEGERLGGPARLEHVVAEPAQEVRGEHAHLLLVLDQEHGLVAA
jgi:PPOX class probable F420-dependent enzyme